MFSVIKLVRVSVITSSVINEGIVAHNMNSAQDVAICSPIVSVDPIAEQNVQIFPNGILCHYPIHPMVSSLVRAFTHGVMCHRIDPSWLTH